MQPSLKFELSEIGNMKKVYFPWKELHSIHKCPFDMGFMGLNGKGYFHFFYLLVCDSIKSMYMLFLLTIKKGKRIACEK